LPRTKRRAAKANGLAMSDSPGPGRGRRGFPFGVLAWLAALFAAGAAIWFLADYFPGGLSSDGDRIDLVRLLTILALISSGLVATRRIRLGEAVRNVAIWTGAAALLVLIYTYQEDIGAIGRRVAGELFPSEPVVGQDGVLTLTQGPNGHFYATGTTNGARIRFMIDTGASDIVLAPADARRIGIDLATLRYTRLYQTANGQGRGAPYILDTLTIGPIQVSDVRVSINEAEMSASLLGMSFLGRLKSFEIRGRKLILRQ